MNIFSLNNIIDEINNNYTNIKVRYDTMSLNKGDKDHLSIQFRIKKDSPFEEDNVYQEFFAPISNVKSWKSIIEKNSKEDYCDIISNIILDEIAGVLVSLNYVDSYDEFDNIISRYQTKSKTKHFKYNPTEGIYRYDDYRSRIYLKDQDDLTDSLSYITSLPTSAYDTTFVSKQFVEKIKNLPSVTADFSGSIDLTDTSLFDRLTSMVSDVNKEFVEKTMNLPSVTSDLSVDWGADTSSISDDTRINDRRI